MKTPSIADIVKINPPRLASNIYLRKRLFKALDVASSRPVIWVAAPGGAGKTTLIASYIKERRLPCLWYQIDQGDNDIASFFHYMGLAVGNAAPRYKRPLPHLTPEYLAGLPAFTRNFFRDVFSRINQTVSKGSLRGAKRQSNLNKGIATHPSGARNDRFIIVFDNYQEAAEDSQLHEVMLNGLAEAPEGINIIIVSRLPLPPAMARLQVSEALSLLNWNDISLTLEESIGIGHLRTKGKGINNEILEVLHKQTQGWVAGLILLLEQTECNITPQTLKDQLNQQTVFDYFAGEIFQRADKATQEFLLKTAFLPKIDASVSEKLTGNLKAKEILNDLTRRNYFIVKHAHPSPAYEYHPLFREFLKDKAIKVFTSEQLTQIKQDAAHLLSECNDIEAAVVLLQQVNNWGLLIPLILKHAKGLVEQGRSQTLEGWLRSLPQHLLEETPCFLYWLGVCRMPFNPKEAQEHFERAFNLFKNRHEIGGMFLSCSAVIDAYLYERNNYTPLGRWITEMENLLSQYKNFPSPEVEYRVTFSMFYAMMFHQPQHPKLSLWEERAKTQLRKCNDINNCMTIGSMLVLYYLWQGYYAKALSVINELRPSLQLLKISPMAQILWYMTESAYENATASFDASQKVAIKGLEIAQSSGIHTMDSALSSLQVYISINRGDLAAAADSLDKMASMTNAARGMDVAHYHHLISITALHNGEFHSAVEHAQFALKMVLERGVPFSQEAYRINLAQALLYSGEQEKAIAYLPEARNIARSMKNILSEFRCLITESFLLLTSKSEKSKEEGVKVLHKAFSLGRKWNILDILGLKRSDMTWLCSKALEIGLETDYAQKLIRKHSLVSEEPPLHLDNWPWAVRIYTLGRFSVVRDQKSLSLAAPSSRKPLELLSALIAFGGRGVSKEMLIEALWPDAEGDVAQQSFETTLHRLRKLLGTDEMLALKDGRLTLDDRFCWVDCWAFERLFTQLEHLLGTADAKPDEVDKTAKKIFALYHGHFLGRESDHSWALTLRERLRSRFLRHIKDMGRYWKGRKKTDESVKYYLKGLEIDPASEGLCYDLMQCCIELGDFTEAISIYKRFCHTLKTLLNTTPSPKIEDLCHSIKHDKTPKQEDSASR